MTGDQGQNGRISGIAGWSAEYVNRVQPDVRCNDELNDDIVLVVVFN